VRFWKIISVAVATKVPPQVSDLKIEELVN
jgi:hypothetical protein